MKISKNFILTILIVSLWIHFSETIRYFYLVMPEVKSFFTGLNGIATLNIPTFIVWAIWGTFLSGFITWMTYLTCEKYGYSFKNYIQAGTVSMVFFFFLFWLGLANMNLARWEFVPVVLVFCLIETVIASIIAGHLLEKHFDLN